MRTRIYSELLPFLHPFLGDIRAAKTVPLTYTRGVATTTTAAAASARPIRKRKGGRRGSSSSSLKAFVSKDSYLLISPAEDLFPFFPRRVAACLSSARRPRHGKDAGGRSGRKLLPFCAPFSLVLLSPVCVYVYRVERREISVPFTADDV